MLLRGLFLVTLAIITAASSAGSAAQSMSGQPFPSRPVTLLVPFSAGGPTDVIARVVGERMGKALGQSIVIENVAGAAGTIAAARVAHAAPDGYTLGVATWSTHIVSPVIYQLSYDVLRDFAPVAMMTEAPLLLIGRKTLPANDVKELMAWMNADPNPVLLGGAGGTDQVAGYLLQQQIGARIQIVPYRGLALALQDLLAGRIDLLFDQPSDALTQIRNGAVKAFAVTAMHRMTTAPEVLTVDETGLPGLHLSPWQSLWTPKGTPDDVLTKLSAATIEALADPRVKKRLGDVGQDVVAPERQTPQALAAFYKAETDKWWPIIKAAGLKAE
jgi:tripartite-type tricarboxylate transporter receptor subunit TctC